MIFGLFWAKVAPNGEFLGPSVECKVLDKSVSHPYGVRSEAITRVYTVLPVLKYTLWMASDLAPYGWDTLFSNTLHSTEGPGNSPFGATLAPKSPKTAKKPLFEPRAATQKKFVDAHIKKRAKGVFW